MKLERLFRFLLALLRGEKWKKPGSSKNRILILLVHTLYDTVAQHNYYSITVTPNRQNSDSVQSVNFSHGSSYRFRWIGRFFFSIPRNRQNKPTSQQNRICCNADSAKLPIPRNQQVEGRRVNGIAPDLLFFNVAVSTGKSSDFLICLSAFMANRHFDSSRSAPL